MIALRAIAPLHHPLNRCAIIGGALRRVLVAGGEDANSVKPDAAAFPPLRQEQTGGFLSPRIARGGLARRGTRQGAGGLLERDVVIEITAPRICRR